MVMQAVREIFKGYAGAEGVPTRNFILHAWRDNGTTACGQTVSGARWEQTTHDWWVVVDADLPRCYACATAIDRAAWAEDTRS